MSKRKPFISRNIEALEPRRLLASGDLDPTFGDGGKTFIEQYGSANDSGTAILRLSDNRSLVACVSKTGAEYNVYLMRYLASGLLDPSFGVAGKKRLQVNWWGIDQIALTPDGKLMARGSPGSPGLKLQRFTMEGELDPTFSPPSNRAVSSFAMSSDGGCYVVGNREVYKLTSTGQLDPSFNGTGVLPFAAPADYTTTLTPKVIAVQADGQILVGGMRYTSATSASGAAIRRYAATGAWDTTYGTPLVYSSGQVAQIEVQSDGKIIATAFSDIMMYIKRFLPTGKVDAFGVSGSYSIASLDMGQVVIQPDGKYLIAARSTQTKRPMIYRLTASGATDTTFDGEGSLTTALPASWRSTSPAVVTTTTTGQILMTCGAGRNPSDTDDLILARYADNGSLDTTFGDASGYTVTDLQAKVAFNPGKSAIQSDGKVIIIGGLGIAVTHGLVKRINTDGTPDLSFGINGTAYVDAGGLQEDLRTAMVLPDGKILIAGGTVVGSYNTSKFLLVRLLPNGSPDPTFGTSGVSISDFGKSSQVLDKLAIGPDGKIVAGGGNQYSPVLLRFSAEGQIDTAFGTLGLIQRNNPFSGIVVQSDGKIVLGGAESSSRYLARLLPNGQSDDHSGFGTFGYITLDAGTGTETGDALFQDSSGNLFLAGTITSESRSLIVTKCNSNGVLDTSFGANGNALVQLPTASDEITSAIPGPEGDVIVGGTFVNDERDFMLIRLTSTGQPDPLLGNNGTRVHLVSGSSESVMSVHLDPQNRIVLAGQYEKTVDYLTSRHWAMMRLIGDVAPPVATITSPVDPGICFTFNETIQTPPAGALQLTDLSNNQPVTIFPEWVSFNAAQKQLSLLPDDRLADGNYRATLIASQIIDAAGNAMAENLLGDFFILAADANRDRLVDTQDFNVLAQNFGSSGRIFSQGNFDYDASGLVDSVDFTVLLSQYGRRLATPSAPASSPFASPQENALGDLEI